MNWNNNPHFEEKGQDFLRSLHPFGISHLVYGFCDNIENIASFGLRARRGRNFSLLPSNLHDALKQEGLNWEHCLPLEHCWLHEADFEWSEDAIWSERQLEIHRLWKRYGFAAGVSLPMRMPLDHETTIGAAVLLLARYTSVAEFRAMYQRNHRILRHCAERFDDEIRYSCMKSFFPLTKGERVVLKHYRRLGDVARIAELHNITARAVQLKLQKARIKLQVDSNTEALNFCRSFGLLND